MKLIFIVMMCVWIVVNLVNLIAVCAYSDKHDLSILEAYVAIVKKWLDKSTTGDYVTQLFKVAILFPVMLLAWGCDVICVLLFIFKRVLKTYGRR